MPYYLALDAGGSKCLALLFDESFHILSEGKSGGVNVNFSTRADCQQNVAQCLAQTLGAYPGIRLDDVWITFVGPIEILREELLHHAQVGTFHLLGEGDSGLLAGALWHYGILALSGTGSDVFYIGAQSHDVVGGFGNLLGDQGSGVWIAQRALRIAFANHMGWGPQTQILDAVLAAWSMKDPWEIADRIHQSSAPFRQIGSLLPVIAQAARAGDAVALEAFEEAGRMIARQMEALEKRVEIPEQDAHCVCCGGAWKAHPAMYQSFVEQAAQCCPRIRVQKPLFEQVMAGVVSCLRIRQPLLPAEEAYALLAKEFPAYCVTW